MAGFLCKQVEPYNYTFDSATAVTAAVTDGILVLNSGTATSITEMSLNNLDATGINRVNWIESFFTSTLTGRDLLSLKYKSYTTVTIDEVTTAGVVTTDGSHNYETGDVVRFLDTGSGTIDNKNFAVTKLTATTFSIGTNPTAAVTSTGSVYAFDTYIDTEVILEVTAASATSENGYSKFGVDWISGTLPTEDNTDVTLSYNKAGLVDQKIWYANCSRVQEGLGICSSTSGAYVPAVTVCKEEL